MQHEQDVQRSPAALTRFIGREAEASRLRSLLEKNRLVTMTGPGGAGKTRLAMHFAEVTAGILPDGIWWVELADLRDAKLLAARVATSAGVHLEMGAVTGVELGQRLANREGLLLLDNCEHLAADVGMLVRGLLSAGPNIKVLTTSRCPLDIAGEVVWSIPPLGLPPDDNRPLYTEAGLRRYPSSLLFLDRARAARPGFAVDPEAAAHIAHLCRHLEGMPLAVELAAARVRSLELHHIREELDRAIDLLSTGGAHAESRHRTMQASIAWSAGLLTSDERRLLRRLAVFVGGFALEDALPVVSSGTFVDHCVIEALDGLVRQSLLMFEHDGRSQGRYKLLEVVRQYAARQLRQAGEDEEIRRRHAMQYASRAAQLGPCLGEDWDDRAFAWLAADAGNLGAAVQEFYDHGQWLQAVEALWDSQYLWGLVRPVMAIHAIEELLDRGDELEPRLQARLYLASAAIQVDAGAMMRAWEAAQRALALAGQAGDALACARARIYCASIHSLADPAGAEDELESALDQCAAAGDTTGEVFGRYWLAASITLLQGAVSRGIPLLVQQLDHAAASTHPLYIAGYNALLAEARIERGEIDAALEHAGAADRELERVAALLGSSAETLKAMSVPGSVAALVRGYAGILRNQQPLPEVDLVAASMRSAAAGHAVAAYFYRFLNGLDHLRKDEPKHALEELDWAEKLAMQTGGWFLGNTRIVGAFAALSAKDVPAAASWLNKVDAAELISPMLRARWHMVQANLALCLGQTDVAEQLAHRELESAAAEQFSLEVAQLLELLSRVAASKESPGEAVRLAGAASRLRSEKGLVVGPPWHLSELERDLAATRELLGERAFEEAWSEGLGLSLTEAVAHARRARGTRRRPSFGWNSLTPTENRVIELVVSGLTNPQIGQQMLITAETVKTHLRHIFAKLDVHNKAQLAAAAQRRPTSV